MNFVEANGVGCSFTTWANWWDTYALEGSERHYASEKLQSHFEGENAVSQKRLHSHNTLQHLLNLYGIETTHHLV